MRLARVLILLGVLALSASGRAAGTGEAVLLDIKGAIGPATSDYLVRGLEKAAARGARLAVLRIDTPGGLDSAMRDIIKAVLASPIPVVGYVTPSGARAASAGTYILYATHLAAMAPGTDLGAATPVQIGGPGMSPPKKDKEKKREDGGKAKDGKGKSGAEKSKDEPAAAGAHPTMRDKVVNEAVAYIRSLADIHGRNADWAAKAVNEAASLPAKEALEQNVIDLIAIDLKALLKAADGRVVKLAGKDHRLDTKGLTTMEIAPDWRSELLAVITNPNVAYILFLAGIYGILLEFYNPGVLVPGVIGAISLLLALYAFQVLPVNYAGLALLLLGMGLMVAEAASPSFGVLGIGGIVAFVIGSIMLLDTDVPGFAISWWLIGSIAALGAGAFLLVAVMFARSRGRAVVSGPEYMIGSSGEVIEWSGGAGRIRTHGEIWQARSGENFDAGRTVRIAEIDGLTLVVQPNAEERDPS